MKEDNVNEDGPFDLTRMGQRSALKRYEKGRDGITMRRLSKKGHVNT